MKHGKYDVARLDLQTLLNTYPDSEFAMRAKLAGGRHLVQGRWLGRAYPGRV